MRNRDKEKAEKYTKAELKAAHDKALKAYIEADGVISNKTLARRALVPASWISKWYKDENWPQFLPGHQPGDKLKLSDKTKAESKKAGPELTDQEWAFCYSYYKCHSATQAYINAGYSISSAENGWKMLSRPDIQAGLESIRAQVSKEAHIEAIDIVNMWAKIAFADMTDYVTISRAGVYLKPGAQVDGQIIQEVKEGRDGVSIKLADRMKALDRLSEYIGVTSDDKTKMAKLILAQRAANGDGEEDGLTIQIVGV